MDFSGFINTDRKVDNSIIISETEGEQETFRFNNRQIYIDSDENKSLINLKREYEEEKFYDMCREMDKKYLVAWNDRGTDFFNEGNYDKAITCYDKALKIDENFSVTLYNKASLLYYQGKYTLSAEYFKKLVDLDNYSVKVLLGLGASLTETEDYDKAIMCFDRALEIDSNDSKVLHNKGCTLARMNKYKEAFHYIGLAMKINPLINKLAMENYERILGKAGERANFWYYKAFVLYYQGKYEKALKCIDEVLKIDKNFKVYNLKELILASCPEKAEL